MTSSLTHADHDPRGSRKASSNRCKSDRPGPDRPARGRAQAPADTRAGAGRQGSPRGRALGQGDRPAARQRQAGLPARRSTGPWECSRRSRFSAKAQTWSRCAYRSGTACAPAAGGWPTAPPESERPSPWTAWPLPRPTLEPGRHRSRCPCTGHGGRSTCQVPGPSLPRRSRTTTGWPAGPISGSGWC
jgi:hypothetical protein